MAGNARLKMVADVIRGVFTGYDIYRYEQDEIVVFCKDIDKKSFFCGLKNYLSVSQIFPV